MSYEEFKEECYKIRDNRLVMIEQCQKLQRLENKKFDGLVNVIDFSKEHLNASKQDPDKKMIDALTDYQRAKDNIKHSIEQLPDENDAVKRVLLDAQTIDAKIAMMFFIMCMSIKDISEQLFICERQCYRKLKQGLKDTYNALQEQEDTICTISNMIPATKH